MTSMLTTTDAETAIRNYLLYLEDPAQLIDAAEIHRLQGEIDATNDPLEKLRVLSRLHRAQQSDEHALREAFCAHVKAWADANEVTATSLEELGVSAEVLRQAGFEPKRLTQPGPSKSRQPSTSGRHRSQHHSVTVDEIKADVIKRTSRFTFADVADSAGGSPMTVRKAIGELIDDGSVERLGPSPDWTRPGRAPILFQTVANQHSTPQADQPSPSE